MCGCGENKMTVERNCLFCFKHSARISYVFNFRKGLEKCQYGHVWNKKTGELIEENKEVYSEVFETTVRQSGNGAHIMLGKKWVGKRVKVSIEEID